MFATSRRVGIIVSVITVMSLGYIVSSAPASSNVFPVIMSKSVHLSPMNRILCQLSGFISNPPTIS